MRTRATELEILDREHVAPETLARVVAWLRFVNRFLGGTAAVAAEFRHVRGPAVVLDVGSGAADIPQDLAQRFPNLRMVALDLSTDMLAFAQGLPRVCGDARRLPFRDRSVDFVVATHFFHHLTDDEVVATLREFDRVARRGIVVNDLLRRRRAWLWIKAFTAFANRVVRFDGPLSVRRGFRTDEIEALARRAGLGWLRTTVRFGHRFTLAGERPGGARGPVRV